MNSTEIYENVKILNHKNIEPLSIHVYRNWPHFILQWNVHPEIHAIDVNTKREKSGTDQLFRITYTYLGLILIVVYNDLRLAYLRFLHVTLFWSLSIKRCATDSYPISLAFICNQIISIFSNRRINRPPKKKGEREKERRNLYILLSQLEPSFSSSGKMS